MQRSISPEKITHGLEKAKGSGPQLTLASRAPDCQTDNRAFIAGKDARRGTTRPDRNDQDGGGAGIRTLGGITPTTVFETVPFNRSGTPPLELLYQQAYPDAGKHLLFQQLAEKTGKQGAL